MKNFLKFSLIITLVFTAFGAFAADDIFDLRAKNDSDKSIVFSINDAQPTNLSIIDANEETLFEEKINSVAKTKKVYNLNALPDGNYTLKLETKSTLTKYQIAIVNGKTMISKPIVREIFKPVLTKEKDVVIMKFENPVKDPIEVDILNEYNEKLYSEVYGANVLGKKFNVGLTNAKELTFVVRTKDQEYIETIQIR